MVLAQLQPLGLEKLDLRVVELPALAPHGEGGLVLRNLGELHPGEWGHLAREARVPARRPGPPPWSPSGGCCNRKTPPMRAVLNGVLVSADESLYDPYLRRVLDTLPETFSEATPHRTDAGAVSPGIRRCLAGFAGWSGWIADGKLQVVSTPEPDSPRYHRMLRKVSP